MRKKYEVAALLALVAGSGVIVGCGDSNSQTPQTSSEPDDNSYSFTVDASPFETAILADGDVSRAELDQAHAATLACMADKGVKDSGINYRPPWTIGFEASASVQGALTGDEVGNITQQCERDFFDAVSQFFLTNHHPSPSDEEEFRLMITACLKEKGVDVDDSIVTLKQLFERYQTEELQNFGFCRTAAEIELSK